MSGIYRTLTIFVILALYFATPASSGQSLEVEAIEARIASFSESGRFAEAAENSLLLARQFTSAGQNAEAEKFYLQGISLYEKANRLDSIEVIQPLKDIANLYNRTHRYSDLDKVYDKLVSVNEKLYGDLLVLANALDELSSLRFETYNNDSQEYEYDKAQPLLLRALAIRERLLGFDDFSVGVTLNKLGIIERRLDHNKEAEIAYTRALSIYEKNYGPEHLDLVTLLTNMATLFASEHNAGREEHFLLRALAI